MYQYDSLRIRDLKKSYEFLYNLIDQSISSTAPFLYAIGDKIDDIESKISKSFSSNFREEIIILKHALP